MAWYNDIPLPDLPEYDTAAYPYACIQKTLYAGIGFIAHLRYSSQPFRLSANAVTNTPGAAVWVRSYSFSDSKYTWSSGFVLENIRLSLKPETVIWCSADILDDSGSVFLAANQPVPAECGVVPDFRLSSWLTGIVIGLASGYPG